MDWGYSLEADRDIYGAADVPSWRLEIPLYKDQIHS